MNPRPTWTPAMGADHNGGQDWAANTRSTWAMIPFTVDPMDVGRWNREHVIG